MSDNLDVVMDEIQEAMAIARAGPWDGVCTPSQTAGYLQDDIQEAAAVMGAGDWYAYDSQGRVMRPMGPSQDNLASPPSPSDAADEREYDFMNNSSDIILPTMEETEWNMLEVAVDPADVYSGPIVKTLTSSIFHPQARLLPLPPDIVLKSSDAVLFYVHEHVLNEASSNMFGGLLKEGHNGGVKDVDEDRDVLGVILCALYDIPSASTNSPSLSVLVTAVDHFSRYGLSPKALVTPANAIYCLLSAYAQTEPMEVYMLAAHHGLEELAVLALAHLASFPLDRITDKMAERMGEAYTTRLVLANSEGGEKSNVTLQVADVEEVETAKVSTGEVWFVILLRMTSMCAQGFVDEDTGRCVLGVGCSVVKCLSKPKFSPM